MAQRGKWLLAAAGVFMVIYSVLVLGFVATSPDLRLRCLIVDEPPDPHDPMGIEIRATPKLDAKGPRPQPGDLLLRIGDKPVPTFLDFTRRLHELRNAVIPPGGQLHAEADPSELDTAYSLPPLVEVDNAGRYVQVEIWRAGWEKSAKSWLLIQSLPLTDVLLTLIWFILQLGVFAFGALAYWKRPFDRPSRLFFMLCVVTLGAFVGGYHWWVVAGSFWLNLPFTVCASLVPAVLLHFFLVFPRPRTALLQRPRTTIVTLYGIPVLAIVAMLGARGYANWLHGGEPSAAGVAAVLKVLGYLRQVIYLYLTVAALFFAATLLTLWSSYAAARNPMERGQLKWLWRGGLVAAVFVGITLYLALYRRADFALGSARIPMFLASLSFMLAYTVGVIRYRLMLVDEIVSKGMLYYVVSCGLTLAFSLMIASSILVPQILNVSLSWQQALSVAAVLMLSVILLLWVRDLLQQIIDRQFFREKYQLDKALEQMNRAVGRLVEPEALAEMMLTSCCDVLRVGGAALYLRTSTDRFFQLVAAEGAENVPVSFHADDAFLDELSQAGSLQRVTPGTRSEISPVQNVLRALHANLVHALRVDRNVVGLVVLGRKKNAAPFTAEDLTFLYALGQITNVALHSAKVDQDVTRLNEDLRLKIDRLADQKRQITLLQSELMSTQSDRGSTTTPDDSHEFRREVIKGNSPAICRVLETVRKVATSESSVLIRGESGTGKELLAQVLHENSLRRGSSMIGVHCASLAPTLLESELFGHVKGAFTGAHRDKIGRFETANGGTLFLDEIGDISLETQVKLLRVVQERCFEPVGGTRTIQVDVRLITATHQDLEELIAEGKFREDLYYRLNVISITLPPLRERREDILELALYFLNRSAEKLGKRITHIDEDALAALERHSWRGNIRELENVIERAVVLAENELISLLDLPAEISSESRAIATQVMETKPLATRTSLMPRMANPEAMASAILRNADSERERLQRALRQSGGNKAEAARLLGLPRSTYYSRLKRYQIE